MSQNYEDTRTYQIGKTGEQIVLELLRSFKKVVRVDDVSDLTQYQVQDVDFVVYMNNRLYSPSKLGVKIPFPIFSRISEGGQKRPPSSSEGSGMIGPS